MVDPTLKWAGGKRHFQSRIGAHIPDEFNCYYEPFLGGGAIAFGLELSPAMLSDINPRLINYYKQVQQNTHELLEYLDGFRDPAAEPDESHQFADTSHFGHDIDNYYYQARARFNKRPYGYDYDPVAEAALLQYLNRTCFNGLYRENQTGGFNTPIGDYDNPDWVQEERVRDLSAYLNIGGVHLFEMDYKHGALVADGDVVYADPPYQPLSSSADFTEYSAEGFDATDQRQLLTALSHWANKGATVIASNSGVMADEYESAGFDVYTAEAPRSINSDATNRDAVDEIIAVRNGAEQTARS